MNIEISTNANFVMDYKEAKEALEKGNTVWTILKIEDKECYEQKLIKKNGIGWIIIPNIIKEITLFKREVWSKR